MFLHINIGFVYLETLCPRDFPHGELVGTCGLKVGNSCDDFLCDYGHEKQTNVNPFNCTESGTWNYNLSSLCLGKIFTIFMISFTVVCKIQMCSDVQFVAMNQLLIQSYPLIVFVLLGSRNTVSNAKTCLNEMSKKLFLLFIWKKSFQGYTKTFESVIHD